MWTEDVDVAPEEMGTYIGKTLARILEDIVVKQKHKLYGSTFTLIEACNTICRKMTREAKWGLSDPLQEYIDVYKDYRDKRGYLISLIFVFLWRLISKLLIHACFAKSDII